MTDPSSFTVIVQSHDEEGVGVICRGYPRLPTSQPTRLLVVADPAQAPVRDALLAEIVQQVDAITQHGNEECHGPGGLRCVSVGEPAARHILIVVAGDSSPSTDLDHYVDGWLARGWEALGVFRAGLNPDRVLPAGLRRQHAPSWQNNVREVAQDVTDALLLSGEDRRVFISYSHADGEQTATRLADLLGHHRFDVFLDRFRLPPGADFVERITDELVDKAMVVVVETPGSVASAWVRQEVATAITRRIGLAGVHLAAGPTISEIAEPARCRIDDDDTLVNFVLTQHRSQLRQRRESLMQSVWYALRRVPVQAHIQPTADGFMVRSAGRQYAMTVRTRPADLHLFRVAHERAAGADTVIVHPRPVRSDRRRDIAWLTAEADLVDIDEGMLDQAAAEIAAGML
jgi:hypothetical protein